MSCVKVEVICKKKHLNLILFKEVTKDQLGVLESIKADEKNGYQEEHMKNQYLIGKEDFHQIMSDWQQHVGLLQVLKNINSVLIIILATLVLCETIFTCIYRRIIFKFG